MTREFVEKIGGWALFAALVIVFLVFGPVALLRVLGVVLAAGGIYSFLQGSIPYGIEGRPPSGYISGTSARLVSLAILALGVLLVAAAPEAACITGWAQSGSCA